MKKFFYNFPLGKIWVAEKDGKICRIFYHDEYDCELAETPLIKETSKQLFEYFSGKRQYFNVPILIEGTEFQKKVWNVLMTIPYGKTVCYGDIAKQIGQPKASRAVGGANNKNRIPIIIPCHRVIGTSGKLVGYADGLEKKEFLLNLEFKYSQK